MPTREFCGYDLIRVLGSGGMAVVHEARKRALNKRVAIKVLRSERSEDADFARRFEREAMNAAKMEHPNIVQVTDFGRCDDTPFIEMEYIDGRDLSKVLRDDGPLPIEISLLMLRDVSSALAHAHAPGREVVHRDIKPSNVMYATEGTVKLTDFGLARAGVGDMSLTVTGQVMGTVPYMSPEQAVGQGMTRLSDIFSMGVMAFELLYGERPFQGESPSAVTRAIQEVVPPRLDRLNPLVPEVVATTVQRMLEKIPDRRCQDIREFERALDEGIEKLGIVHERRLLREFASEPAETKATLRRRRIQKHLDQGLYFEKLGAGRIEDAVLEFKRVLVLDPENATAREHLDQLKSESDRTEDFPPQFLPKTPVRPHTLRWALGASAVVLAIVAALLVVRLPSTSGDRAKDDTGVAPAPSSAATNSILTPTHSTPPTPVVPAGTRPPSDLPQPAAIVDSGEVKIAVSPAATIVVDGGPAMPEMSSMSVRLAVGAHRVRATNPQYDAKEWNFNLTRSGRKLEWNFVENVGKITISSLTDCWAFIRIDGRDTGQHTPVTLPLRAGNYLIEVYKEGTVIPQSQRTVTIQTGRLAEAAFDVPCTP